MSAQLVLLVVIATTFCVIAADHEDVGKRRFIRKSRDAQDTDLELDKRRFLRKSRGSDDEHYDAPIEKRRFIRKSRAAFEDEASVEKRRFIRKSRDALDESENSVEKRRFIRKSRSLPIAEEEHAPESLMNADACLHSAMSNCSCERSPASDSLTCSCPNSVASDCELDRCCSLNHLPDSRVRVVCNC